MYYTEYGFQGVDGIMADYGIQSFSDFESEEEVRAYFTVENCAHMFGVSDEEPLTQDDLDAIASEFISEWIDR